MFELVDAAGSQAVIKVIGVGGGGGNAVDHMMKTNIEGVDFINANTDAQVLDTSMADTTLQLGESLTKGLGAGPARRLDARRRWKIEIVSPRRLMAQI